MSIPNRIYRIAKAYLNQARDRIEALDAELAERELQGPGETPPAGGETSRPAGRPAPARDDTSPEAMMRRAEERIRAAGTDGAARAEAGRAPGSRYSGDPAAAGGGSASAAADPNAADYRVIGVPVGSDWASVQAAYEKLARRCDPRRFPEGSEEQKDAERILERVNRAYEALRKRLDPTESRFAKLEF